MDFRDMTKNIATAEADFNEQKAALQQEAEMGEKAAAFAAKMPVDPETVIEGFMMWRRIRSCSSFLVLCTASTNRHTQL